MKIMGEDNQEIEVYTAAERDAFTAEEVKKKEEEFAGKSKAEIAVIVAERDEARKALGERAGEFKQFRKLNDEALAKLSVAERTIYENGLLLQEEREKNKTAEKARIDAQVETALRGKAGTDEKLFGKMKEMYEVIAIEATTPEEIDRKTMMVLGALGTTQPDLVASVAGFSSGAFEPPKPKSDDDKSFADTDAGKAAANSLGLLTEAPKKDNK